MKESEVKTYVGEVQIKDKGFGLYLREELFSVQPDDNDGIDISVGLITGSGSLYFEVKGCEPEVPNGFYILNLGDVVQSFAMGGFKLTAEKSSEE